MSLVFSGVFSSPDKHGQAYSLSDSRAMIDPNNTGNSSFTIETWFKHQPGGGEQSRLFAFDSYNNGNTLAFWWDGNNAGVDYKGTRRIQTGSVTALYDDAWHHLAICYNASTDTISAFVDGSSIGSGSGGGGLSQNNVTLGLLIGGENATDYNTTVFKGKVSNFRIVVGTVLYPSNFTPSTSALTAVSGTTFLLQPNGANDAMIDNGPSNFAPLASFGTSFDTDTPVTGGGGGGDGGDGDGGATLTVTYNANSGTGAPTDNANYASAATVTVQFTPAPTRTGYTFDGWSTNANGTGDVYRSTGTTSFAISANTTLYAIWVSAGGGGAYTINWNTSKFTVTGSNVKADSNVTDWDAYATDTNAYTSDIILTATMNQNNLQCMFGFATSSSPPFPVYSHMPFCLYPAATGTLFKFDGGLSADSLGTYSANDVLEISFISGVLTYKQNGTIIHTRSQNSLGNLHACFTAGIANAQFNNVSLSSPAPPVTAPGAPTLNTVVADAQSLTVNWTAPANNGGAEITGYKIKDANSNFSPITVAANASPYKITGLSEVSHNISVVAVNSAGDSADSNSISRTPFGSSGPTGTALNTFVSTLTTTLTSSGNFTTAINDQLKEIPPAIVAVTTRKAIKDAELSDNATTTAKLEYIAAMREISETQTVPSTSFADIVASANAVDVTAVAKPITMVYPSFTETTTTVDVSTFDTTGETYTLFEVPKNYTLILVNGTSSVSLLNTGTNYYSEAESKSYGIGDTIIVGNFYYTIFLLGSMGGGGTALKFLTLTATAGDGQVTLSWSTNFAPAFFNVAQDALPIAIQGVTFLSGTTTSATITGLTNDTQYAFNVQAFSAANFESFLAGSEIDLGTAGIANVTPTAGGGGAGDPYIKTAAGISYKLPIMDGAIRFYQGEVDGKTLTVNATLKTQSSTELAAHNIRSLIDLSPKLGAKKTQAIFKKLLETEETLCFFDKIYVSYGENSIVAQVWDSSINVKDYTGGFQTKIHDNNSEALAATGIYSKYSGKSLELTVGESARVVISIYNSPMVRSGLYVVAPGMSKGNGVIVNALSQADMTINSIIDKATVPKRDSARLRTVKETFIDSAGARVRNVVTY